jgi:hypothetical protein
MVGGDGHRFFGVTFGETKMKMLIFLTSEKTYYQIFRLPDGRLVIGVRDGEKFSSMSITTLRKWLNIS